MTVRLKLVKNSPQTSFPSLRFKFSDSFPGIPHGFAVMHGKTRRGALVFDIADLIKDTLILPWAFICAKEGATEQEFRQQCLQNFTTHMPMDFMFDTIKVICKKGEKQ